jgi:hypothetical protein
VERTVGGKDDFWEGRQVERTAAGKDGLLSTMELVVASEFAPCGSPKLLPLATSIITVPRRLEPETVSSGTTTGTL